MTTRVVRRAIHRAMEMSGVESSSLVKLAANKQQASRRHGGGEGRGLSTASGGRGGGDRDDIPSPPTPRRLLSQRQKRQHRGQQPPRQLTILSDSFRYNFHAKLCRAASYKVHAPMCTCPKIVDLRSRASTITAKRDENKDVILSGLLDRLDIKSTAEKEDAGGSNNGVNNNNNNNNETVVVATGATSRSIPPSLLDNLLVLPDTKSVTPSHVYSCVGTDRTSFEDDWIGCETKLAREIFGNHRNRTPDEEEDSNVPVFKVSCAVCLLRDPYQPNGFVAIVSKSSEEIRPTIQRAREACKQRRHNDLHADHAHFVCAVELSSLRPLLSKSPSAKTRASLDIARQIAMDDDIHCLPAEMMERIDAAAAPVPRTSATTLESVVQIKVGHHLSSLLYILSESRERKGLLRDVMCVMVMGYVDGPYLLTLDLPGGKRHLGESTLRGVIREVEEECSLAMDHEYLFSKVSDRYGGGLGLTKTTTNAVVNEDEDAMVRVLTSRGKDCHDVFFVMTPPPQSILHYTSHVGNR